MGDLRHFIGAGSGARQPQAIIKAHNTFHNAEIAALCIFAQQIAVGIR